MKKFLLMIALTLALVAFVACGDEEAEETTDDATEENGEVEAEVVEEAAPAVEVDLSTADKCVEAFIKAAADKDKALLSAICIAEYENTHQFMIDNLWPTIDPGGLVFEGGYEIEEDGDVKFDRALFTEDGETRYMSLMVKQSGDDWVIYGSSDGMYRAPAEEEVIEEIEEVEEIEEAVE